MKSNFEFFCEKAKEAKSILITNKIFADVIPWYWCDDTGTACDGIRVSINWGDWKHDHAATRYLLTKAGYVYDGSTVFEEDGSDCYSADYYFKVA